ncbi:GNAT family N-acetyltransferase [Flavobacterium dankookense]|uniref:Acetyltransferase (GNAT) family protein n=1 Tax=Flavobacterium dankookense TaxID=706186 RepID=A0A4R6QAP2_9FLAO|nr:GNAT family N-acetyltransferase [Flavobacterium dankookense]TDP59431.1 acetyltransferase (GNAT) family protein [Flavobacterium dankookense]
MFEIIKASENQLDIIQDIAQKTWPVAYKNVISENQIDYMLDLMYSKNALLAQTQKNHHFILAKEENFVGFASYEFDCGEKGKTKIHKLYVLPSIQAKGIGNELVKFIADKAQNNNQSTLFLNVNKNNSAQFFYKKVGFSIAYEEVIDIGNGFLMDDYVMEKSI